jgi:hypothetical protein
MYPQQIYSIDLVIFSSSFFYKDAAYGEDKETWQSLISLCYFLTVKPQLPEHKLFVMSCACNFNETCVRIYF